MPREGKVSIGVERVVGKGDQWKKIVQETEAFYKKLDSNPIEIDIGDIFL